MAGIYTDVDRLILDRWDEVSDLLAAREELQDRIAETIEAAGQKLERALEPRGYLVESQAKDGEFHVYRSSWNDRRRGPSVYFTLGAFCPRGYRKVVEPHPYLWLMTETLANFRVKDEERRSLAAAIRRALGAAAESWDHEDCYDDAPVGRSLTRIGNRQRAENISSPSRLYDFALAELEAAFEIADIVERCVEKHLAR